MRGWHQLQNNYVIALKPIKWHLLTYCSLSPATVSYRCYTFLFTLHFYCSRKAHMQLTHEMYKRKYISVVFWVTVFIHCQVNCFSLFNEYDHKGRTREQREGSRLHESANERLISAVHIRWVRLLTNTLKVCYLTYAGRLLSLRQHLCFFFRKHSVTCVQT